MDDEQRYANDEQEKTRIDDFSKRFLESLEKSLRENADVWRELANS